MSGHAVDVARVMLGRALPRCPGIYPSLVLLSQPRPLLDPAFQGSPPPMYTLYHVTWWHGRWGGVRVIILRIGSSANRTGRHEAVMLLILVMLLFILWYRVWLPCGPAWPGLLDGCGLVLAQLRLT